MAQTPYSPPSTETATQRTFTDPAVGVGQPLAQPERGLGEGLQVVTSNFKHALDRSLHADPMATLAMASIVGFVLGAIWKA
jgi:hypothetical protein